MKSSISPASLVAWLAFAAALMPQPTSAQSTPALTMPASTPPATEPAGSGDSSPGGVGTTTVRPARAARGAVELQAQAIASVQTLLDAKRTSDALQVAERSLREFPDNTQLRFLQGVALADSGQSAEAIRVFNALTRDNPELAEPYNNLAVLHAADGNLKAARDALEAAVVAVPDYALAHENLGDLYLRLAVEAYQSSTRQPKTTAAARRKLVLARGLLDQVIAKPPAR